MIIVDKPKPEKCAGCWAMRCSKCIISDSKNISDYQANGTKPDWCPVKEDVDIIIDSLQAVMENDIRFDDEWFKGKVKGLECTIEIVKRYVE